MDKHTVSFSLKPKPKRALRLLYQDYNVQQRCRPKCPRVGGLPVRGFRSSTAATSASAAAEPVDAHASNCSSTTHEQQDPAVGASDADAHGAHVHSPSAQMEEEYFDLPLPAGVEQEDNAATAKKQSYDSEGNWQEFMQAAPGVYLDTLPQQLQLLQDQSSWLLSQLNAAVSSGECPTCGLSTEECKILKCVDVFVFDISNCCKSLHPYSTAPGEGWCRWLPSWVHLRTWGAAMRPQLQQGNWYYPCCCKIHSVHDGAHGQVAQGDCCVALQVQGCT